MVNVTWSSAGVFQPVGPNIGGTSDVLHDGDPNVVMQRPWASAESGAPAAAAPMARRTKRRERRRVFMERHDTACRVTLRGVMLKPGERIGPYEVIAPLGSGGAI